MRLFVSIRLPLGITESMYLLQKQIPAHYFENLKVVKQENLHITLLFLGQVKEEQLFQIEQKLSSITNASPIELSLGILEIRSHILWITVNSQTLETLSFNISELFPEYKQERSFSAHITIARYDATIKRDGLNDSLESLYLGPRAWRATEFTLEESITHQVGPEYRTIRTFELKDR